ncbi:DUF4123 domain-containing protein [Derxia gummosa]|uniref:DUF4123 domain-containing protein n=1 Tax=Derxia gummosa DSM 723 TaxID=1121388 RepID=A0A8B6X241_9BURK|nr:DUF4123 domain-containing protein [Derxia gummosa]
MKTVPLSADQLKGRLWSRPDVAVIAVLDGARLARLPSRIAEAGLADTDSLTRGALLPVEAERAVRLAVLAPELAFTDWLLAAAHREAADWGLLCVASGGLRRLRDHLRTLAEVSTPDGIARRWRWHAPELLACLLPLLDPWQADEFFGPVAEILAPDGAGFLRYEREPVGVRVEQIALIASPVA